MYRQHQDASAGAEQHHFLSASSATSSFGHAQFPSPIFGIDPSLAGTPQSAASTFAHRLTNDSPASMQPPSSTSPRAHRTTSLRNSPLTAKQSVRSLPPEGVTADTITDAYVAFILYCNPQFSLDVDTTTLRSVFNSLPKSDNKDFPAYRLFELIKKFDAKEIKTWSQLALDLGVEAPDTSKGQSVQKVQQYSVRLKRWMRAMHIDAFFEYLQGRQHVYFTEIPSPANPYPPDGRDGVSAEEDLAIRALEPSFRPKRGRRRNSETEQDEDAETDRADKHAEYSTISDQYGVPMTAIPHSAHPDGHHDPWTAASAITQHSLAPWSNRNAAPQSAMTATAPSHLRWQLHGSSLNASTPHPMTAQPTSMAAHIDSAFDSVPKSAITPSTRKRRKHGPAVSSAWPSANAPGSKPRGRPPASRQTQDGPFSTFPVDPANEKSGSAEKPTTPDQSVMDDQEAMELPPPLASRQIDGSSRPSRLSLQVPHHTGGPVRLATAPRVLVNGETNSNESQSDTRTSMENVSQGPPGQPQSRNSNNLIEEHREMPSFAYEALKRVLASDILRADLLGRHQRLSGDEAKRLSEAILERLGVPRLDNDDPRDDVARITAASWLGLGEQFNVPLGPATSPGKRILVTRFRQDVAGYEEIVSAQDDGAGGVREVFDLAWVVSLNGCSGSFELKGLSLADSAQPEDRHDMLLRRTLAAAKSIGGQDDTSLEENMRQIAASQGHFTGDTGVDWKSRCIAMEFGCRMAQGEVLRLRKRMVEKVLDAALQA